MKGFLVRARELARSPASAQREAQARELAEEVAQAHRDLKARYSGGDERLDRVNLLLVEGFAEAGDFLRQALLELNQPPRAKELLRMAEEALERADALVDQVRQAMLRPTDFGQG